MPFINAMNDHTLKNISDCIKSVFTAKAKAGQKISGTAPYRYIRDPDNHTGLIVDRYASAAVEKIFALRLERLGYAKIAFILNSENILPPRQYYYKIQNRETPKQYSEFWQDQMVKIVFRNEIYIGNTVQMKHKTISHRNSKMINRAEDEWIKTENTHEPIIDRETWDKVQVINKDCKRKGGNHREKHQSLFLKLLVCADCGTLMTYNQETQVRKSGDVKKYGSYTCRKHKVTGGSACSRHTIYEISLKTVVSDHIKSMSDMLNFDRGRIKSLLNKNFSVSADSNQHLKEQKTLKQRLHKIDILTSESYENKVMGITGEDEFLTILFSLNKEREVKEKRLAYLDELIKQKNPIWKTLSNGFLW